jgi:hypothetical protein
MSQTAGGEGDATLDSARHLGPATTGHPRVDAALAELARIAHLPPAEQVDGYAAIQRELHETLAALDDGR